MPQTVTVWAVELGRDSDLKEHKGALSLDASSLRFAPTKEAGTEVEFPLREIRQVKRLRGSPVLLIVRGADGVVRRTAFYFVQPPPLPTEHGGTAAADPRGLVNPGSFRLGAFANQRLSFRNPRRRARKQNVGYLGIMNKEKKAEIAEWERAVREAVAAVRGSDGG
jgi:hypothetical protein